MRKKEPCVICGLQYEFAIIWISTTYVFAVYTAHIWDVNTSGEYTDQTTIYVKGPYSGGPDNSPLHESWNLADEYVDGSPNPHFIGGPHPGLFYRFIFYDGTLHIDPNGKVGFWEKIFASGNDSTTYAAPQKGTVTVEGYLFGPELRPWKNGCPMELNLMDGGVLEISNILRVGVSDGGVNTGVFNLSGGLAKLNNLDKKIESDLLTSVLLLQNYLDSKKINYNLYIYTKSKAIMSSQKISLKITQKNEKGPVPKLISTGPFF